MSLPHKKIIFFRVFRTALLAAVILTGCFSSPVRADMLAFTWEPSPVSENVQFYNLYRIDGGRKLALTVKNLPTQPVVTLDVLPGQIFVVIASNGVLEGPDSAPLTIPGRPGAIMKFRVAAPAAEFRK